MLWQSRFVHLTFPLSGLGEDHSGVQVCSGDGRVLSTDLLSRAFGTVSGQKQIWFSWQLQENRESSLRVILVTELYR